MLKQQQKPNQNKVMIMTDMDQDVLVIFLSFTKFLITILCVHFAQTMLAWLFFEMVRAGTLAILSAWNALRPGVYVSHCFPQTFPLREPFCGLFSHHQPLPLYTQLLLNLFFSIILTILHIL